MRDRHTFSIYRKRHTEKQIFYNNKQTSLVRKEASVYKQNPVPDLWFQTQFSMSEKIRTGETHYIIYSAGFK